MVHEAVKRSQKGRLEIEEGSRADLNLRVAEHYLIFAKLFHNLLSENEREPFLQSARDRYEYVVKGALVVPDIGKTSSPDVDQYDARARLLLTDAEAAIDRALVLTPPTGRGGRHS